MRLEFAKGRSFRHPPKVGNRQEGKSARVSPVARGRGFVTFLPKFPSNSLGGHADDRGSCESDGSKGEHGGDL